MPKYNRAAFPSLMEVSSSCHVTGTDTNGLALFARSEYTPTVVLKSAFWLQSINTLFLRSVFAVSATTRLGCCSASSSAIAFAKGCVRSYVTFVLKGTHIRRPFDPE